MGKLIRSCCSSRLRYGVVGFRSWALGSLFLVLWVRVRIRWWVSDVGRRGFVWIGEGLLLVFLIEV